MCRCPPESPESQHYSQSEVSKLIFEYHYYIIILILGV